MDNVALEDGIFGDEAFEYEVDCPEFHPEEESQTQPHSCTQFKKQTSEAKADSTMGKILQFDSKSSAYMNQGKYFEAYGLLKSQYKLGPKIHFAPVLVKYFVSLMQTDRSDKVEKIRDELAELLKDKFAESADEIYKYAEYLLEENKLWEAVLFYQISLLYCEKPSANYDYVYLLQKNIARLTDCVAKIVSTNPQTKKLLKQHVISWIKKAQELTSTGVAHNKDCSAFLQVHFRFHHARCFLVLQEISVAEKLFKEAIHLAQHCRKSDAENKVHVALCLYYLGFICYRTNRFDEAEKYLNKSMEAAKKAKQFSDYHRNKVIQDNEQLLKKIKEHKK